MVGLVGFGDEVDLVILVKTAASRRFEFLPTKVTRHRRDDPCGL